MFKRIGSKLIFAVAAVAIIVIGIFAFTNLQSQRTVLLAETERHVSQISETVKSSTKYDMLLNRRDGVHNIISMIARQSCIQQVRVLNKMGEVMYSPDSVDIGTMVDMQAEACYGCHAADQPLQKLPEAHRTRIYRIHPDSARVMGIINPIYNEPSCWQADCHAHSAEQTVLGVLDITVCLREIDEQMRASQYRMLLFAVISILSLSLVLGIFVKRLVDKPVKDLVKATQTVASGNLNYTIQKIRNDELGILARSFNNMTQKLSEARLQLFQSDKMASLGRLAAGVAHEINNPLTGILTYSSFLLKRTKDNADMQQDLSVIVRETKRSREIVKGLLDFARQSVPKKRENNINEVIERSLSVIENELAIKHIKIVKQFNQNLPKVTIDSNQIQQVFINLLVNAGHAIGDDGGTITLSTNAINLLPHGVALVKHAVCPKGHDLMDHALKVDGVPSIKMRIRQGKNEGHINLDAIYGKNENLYGFELNPHEKMEIMCPKCSLPLYDKNKSCPECDAVIYTFEVPAKGIFRGCINQECGWQQWEEIEREGSKEYVEVKVTDTGCGIPKENLDKIFDPFFSTKGQKGTGLGLAVIWGIIDNHEGTITVDSTVGTGTAFIIRLPVSR